ncbi:MAG: hypothetical protein LBM08_13445 [Dysgonamonadaceae bacterium]|jgi:hypothetical protein|nr:hypothetical protein [Dysgonamonadaceae bacterium]
MKTIHKYKLNPDFVQRISMPKGAKPLCVRELDNECYMWAQIDDKHPTSEMEVYAIGTGCAMPKKSLNYIGTCQFKYGFVFHFFWTWVTRDESTDNND